MKFTETALWLTISPSGPRAPTAPIIPLQPYLVRKQTLSKTVKWYMKCFIYWTADLKSRKLWSSQLWTQFKRSRKEAWKSQDFNGVWTRDLAIPVRRSNQLSYEATDVGSWSFVSSNELVKNGCEVIYEMIHILNCGFEIKKAMIIAVMNAIYAIA